MKGTALEPTGMASRNPGAARVRERREQLVRTRFPRHLDGFVYEAERLLGAFTAVCDPGERCEQMCVLGSRGAGDVERLAQNTVGIRERPAADECVAELAGENRDGLERIVQFPSVHVG